MVSSRAPTPLIPPGVPALLWYKEFYFSWKYLLFSRRKRGREPKVTQKLYYQNKSNGGILENNRGREWVGSLKGSGETEAAHWMKDPCSEPLTLHGPGPWQTYLRPICPSPVLQMRTWSFTVQRAEARPVGTAWVSGSSSHTPSRTAGFCPAGTLACTLRPALQPPACLLCRCLVTQLCPTIW